ncbi:MAG: metallophosphoesterase [Methanobacteriaceae archaeon]|nr:metallophosphoesterase [Methanobacteriaceae archaeon]
MLKKIQEQKQEKTMQAKKHIQIAMNKTRDNLSSGSTHPKTFALEKINIIIPKLQKEFYNYKIAHITDIHLGQWITQEKLDIAIDITNNEKPDLVALTGDYVSYSIDTELNELESSLKKLQPKDKTISVLGNHDHWTNSNKVRKTLKNAGIINLDNDVYTIHKNKAQLQIAGVDSITLNKDDINKVLPKINDVYPAIMLAHEPDFADVTAKTEKFALQLSGHSHGGQFVIPKLGTPIRGHNFLKYPIGLYKVGNMIQYTNRGLGTNMFWLRINCAPEITIITLNGDK